MNKQNLGVGTLKKIPDLPIMEIKYTHFFEELELNRLTLCLDTVFPQIQACFERNIDDNLGDLALSKFSIWFTPK